MFAGVNISSPAEEDADDEQDEQDDLGTAGRSHSTVFECGADTDTKSAYRKAGGTAETTFAVFTQGDDETLVAWARWGTASPELLGEVPPLDAVMQWRRSARKRAPCWAPTR